MEFFIDWLVAFFICYVFLLYLIGAPPTPVHAGGWGSRSPFRHSLREEDELFYLHLTYLCRFFFNMIYWRAVPRSLLLHSVIRAEFVAQSIMVSSVSVSRVSRCGCCC